MKYADFYNQLVVSRMFFNAFFTTKEVGKGMGPGLFIVKDITYKLDWKIDVDSVPGQGDYCYFDGWEVIFR